MKLKTSQALDAVAAIRKLDSARIKDGKTLYAMARNLRRLSTIEKETLETRNRLISEISGGGKNIIPGTPEAAKFEEQMTAVMDELNEVDVFPIDFNLLDPTVNSIPISVMVAMEPLLKNLPDLVEALPDK